jgi:DNA repair exonuclease SbcCD nuclease subunit
LRHTFAELLNIARERHAEAITIAGDLFENERVQLETLKFLAGHFAQLSPTPVFIAPGLRDHAGPHSAYLMQRWPANVHVFLNSTLSDRSLSSEYELWGAARLHDKDQENVLEGFVAPNSGKIPILLLHTLVAQPLPEETNEPGPNRFDMLTASRFDSAPHHKLTEADSAPPHKNKEAERGKLMASRFDMLTASRFDKLTASRSDMLTLDGIAHSGFSAALIGRQHERFTAFNGKCTIICPGSAQPLGFDDAGEHGAAWIVLSPGNETLVEWLPLKSEPAKGLDFKTVDIPVDREKSTAMLIDTISQALRYQSLRDSIVRVRLIGSASPALHIDAKTLSAQIDHHCGYLQIENHTPPAASHLETITRLGKEPTVRGAFVREMIAQRSAENASQKLHHEALLYGIEAFEQENIVLR